jgi:hypothetical protein
MNIEVIQNIIVSVIVILLHSDFNWVVTISMN